MSVEGMLERARGIVRNDGFGPLLGDRFADVICIVRRADVVAGELAMSAPAPDRYCRRENPAGNIRSYSSQLN
jgi:hypothetical protein